MALTNASPEENRTTFTLTPVALSYSWNSGRTQFSGQIEYAWTVSAPRAGARSSTMMVSGLLLLWHPGQVENPDTVSGLGAKSRRGEQTQLLCLISRRRPGGLRDLHAEIL